jgi:hypothetical protein
MPGTIRDLIYFDFEKAASIYSQLEGGLRERVSISEDSGKDRNAGTKFGIPRLAEAKLGVEYTEKTSILETKFLHHDLLNRVEEQLESMDVIADIDTVLTPAESSAENIRAAIGEKPYIRASGWGVLEDYQRILSISENFNEIIKFIAYCGTDAMKQTPKYIELQGQIQDARGKLSTIKDKNQRAAHKERINAIEKTISKMLGSQLTPVDQRVLDGVKLWINTFMPNRINFRIYPFEKCPSFQVLCNLKRESFVDQDLEHLLYGYGNRPNIQLAVFGLITSLPSQVEELFDPMKEFKELANKNERTAFEEAFRGIFGAMDQIEAFVRYSRYPNVTIHPIAVFRQFETAKTT